MRKIYFYLFFILFFKNTGFAQEKRPNSPTINAICTTPVVGCNLFSTLPSSSLVCSNSSITYQAPVGNSCVDGISSTNWNCISSRPNQTWFYIIPQTSGNLTFHFDFTVISGTANWVDGIIWGPIANDNLVNACSATSSAPISCDFDSIYETDLSIPNAQAGKIYVMAIMNYGNRNMNIHINQPSGGSVQYCMAPPVTQNCTFADCNSSTNCGNSPAQSFLAVDYLCQQQIVKGYTPQTPSTNRILSASSTASSNIERIDLAKITTLSLLDFNQRIAFANNPTGSTFIAENFPVPFVDSQKGNANEDSVRYAKILSYLDYGDGRSPFDRNRVNFDAKKYISRGALLKVLLEAWNINENINTGSLPFTDVPTSHGYYDYILKAYNLGIVTGTGGTFSPDANCTREDAFLMLYRLMTNTTITKPTLAQINAGFFIPNIFRPETIGLGASVDRGNFNHYTKTSFALDGLVPLVFAHSYNSYTTELPDELFPNYLGRGWTHSFNCYITSLGSAPNARIIVHYPDGTFHYYKGSGTNWTPETLGVYDTFTPSTDGLTITITTPNKIVYTFGKVTGASGNYYLIKTIKDRNNNTLTFTNEVGANTIPRVKSVADPAGRNLNFTYLAGENYLTQVSLSGVGTFNGRNVQFTYDTPPNGFNDKFRNLASYKEYDINASLKTTTYGYFTPSDSSLHLLKTIALPKGNVIDNTYQQRKLKSSRTMNGTTIVQKMDVNLTPSYTTTNTTSSSSVSTFDGSITKRTDYVHNKNGLPTSVATSGTNNVQMGMSYNNSNDPTAVTALKEKSMTTDSVRITYATTTPFNPLTVTIVGPSGSITQTYTYNTFNDVLTHKNGRNFTTTFEYNATGNLTKVIHPIGNPTVLVRNTNGTVQKVTSPAGVVSTLGYNTYGNLTSTTIANGTNPAIVTSAVYDTLSRVTSTTDARNNATNYTYWANDLLKKTTAPLSYTIDYTYDANDNNTSIINAKGNATTMSYHPQTDQLMSRSFAGKIESFTYYGDGSLKTYTNKRGNVFTFTYDESGRVKNDSYSTYTYNTDGTVNTISHTQTTGNKTYTLDYDYDILKRVSKTTCDGFGVQYQYDNNNNLIKVIYPDGKTVTYTYDAKDRITSITDWAGRVTTYTLDNDGKVLNYVLPNTTKAVYTYDAAGRPKGISNQKSAGTIISSYTFTLDQAGNHTEENLIEPFDPSPMQVGGTTSYTNNAANQTTAAGTNTYVFDGNGAENNQAGQVLTYDTRDNVLTAYGKTFFYDGNETRRAKTGKRYVINELSNSVIAETNDGGTYLYYYVYGPTGLLYRQNASTGAVEYYHYDYRGSTIAMTDASQNIVRSYQYDAYGKILQQSTLATTDNNPFRYVGQHGVQYEEANLYFMRARYYDPTTGKFLSEDPIWNTNLYAYGKDNPINKIDPSGLIDYESQKATKITDDAYKYLDLTVTTLDAVGLKDLNGASNALTIYSVGRDSYRLFQCKDNTCISKTSLDLGITGAGTVASAYFPTYGIPIYVASSTIGDINTLYHYGLWGSEGLDENGSLLYDTFQMFGNKYDNLQERLSKVPFTGWWLATKIAENLKK